MKLEEARVLADRACRILACFCDRVEVAGSIRRGKVEVGDIDIVAVPKAMILPGAGLFGAARVTADQAWNELIPLAFKKACFLVEASGKELLRCFFLNGCQVDIYRARPETWGVILLVRTGSKEHNVKLCTIAQSKGMKLSASQGLLDKSGIVACRTEEGIFSALGLNFVEPKDREVRF